VTSLRVAALVAGALALSAAAPFLRPPVRRATAPAASAPAALAPPAVPAAAPAALPAAFPAGAASPDLHGVPPGILSRAADARALERAPAPICRPSARAEATACAPGRDTVEVQWDVAREP
jgi:hypothetical protein